ncbi:MAG: type IV toxin-antitoxin system AbiEi family antitoxin domain-containing protein [Candidatus Humimicrobiaceae bacterium]
MKYLDLISQLKKNNLIIFSLRDIENLFPEENQKTIKNNLSRWIEKNLLARLRKNLYELIEPGLKTNIPDVYVANKLYTPSYISLETALSIYSLIPDIAFHVTSLTTLPTREFKNKYGSFFYRSCQKKAFTGYRLMQYEGFKILIADKEKALVDFLYFSLRQKGPLNFEEERFERDLISKLNWERVLEYAKLFNIKTKNKLLELKGWSGC